jgi:hypothetical protein
MKIKDFVEVLADKSRFITVRSIFTEDTQMRAYCMRNSELEIVMVDFVYDSGELIIYVREEDLSE